MKYNFTITTFKNYLHILFLISTVVVLLISFNFYKNFKVNEQKNLKKFISNIYFAKTLDTFFENIEPRYETINYKVESGDSFEKILNFLEINENNKKVILENVNKQADLLKIYKNQNILFKVDKKNSEIIELNIELDSSNNIIISKNLEDNKFKINKITKILNKKLAFEESKITNSLYNSALSKKIPPNVIVDFARIYGFQVDFQRDIWKNDSFQIIYEKYINEKDELIKTGNILYANLNLQGRQLPLYLFKINKDEEHYDESGQSIKKTLMKTPINGARLSSSFGKRKHPILGFTKMHLGTDFAAPMGTPIMASGDGKVIKVGWCGGGGNCVKIKHNSIYSTVYAHMSKFARGMKKGKIVRQGQIIGYVGSTGMSTGPHLHYEVIENGRKINSQKLKLPSGKILKGKDRENFEINKLKIKVLKSNLIVQGN